LRTFIVLIASPLSASARGVVTGVGARGMTLAPAIAERTLDGLGM